MKKVAMCKYCGDPIYAFQDVTEVKDKGKYHKGCYKIWREEENQK